MFLLVGILLATAYTCAEDLEVVTSLGRLSGSKQLSRKGKEYFAFTRIPFAKPPLGQLRFMPPVPSDPWTGTLNATGPPAVCYQRWKSVIGTEDCLYLNIYTPKLNGSLPVMVYFHGGGWRVGFPGPVSTSRYFLDEDVILVAPSYRLGSFGFLSTEDEIIPGNMGLKDMALALEWTKREIKNFGGNPELITAFGISAGSASVHYLCALPRTKGLLKGCISQSGVGGAFWSLFKPGLARTSAFKVANALDCSGDGLLECLQSKPANEIIATQDLLKFQFMGNEPLIIYGPVLEGKREGALITEWPAYTDFPWVTGITSAEGYLKSGASELLGSNTTLQKEFEGKKEELILKMLNIDESKRDAAIKIYNRFFLNTELKDGMRELYGEAYFIYPVFKEMKNHKGPKYFYLFDYTDGPSVWQIYSNKTFNLTAGAAHGDDMYYFFDTGFYPASPAQEPKHVELSEKLIKLWVTFAKDQNPDNEWQLFGDSNRYLYIGNSGMSQKNYDSEKINEILNFWSSIY